jgi:predicted secreted protein
MTSPAPRHLIAFALALGLSAGGSSAIAQAEPALPTVELSAEASRRAANDLATATAYVEASDINPARLAQQVNEVIAAALAQTRHYPDVKTRSSAVHTWPVYGKEGRKIEGWRMRSEIALESRDMDALAELLGKLQTTLAVAQLTMQPAPETARRSADEAAADAIRAFEGRAKALAGTLGKRHRIRHLAVNYGGTPGPIRPMMRMAGSAAEAAPVPMEAGDSEVTVTVNGTIELID